MPLNWRVWCSGQLVWQVCRMFNNALNSAGLADFPIEREGQVVQKSELQGHILLVEDNPVNQHITQLMLELLEFQVTIANHGQEAIDLLDKQSVDLILMDCQMPVMDGISATRKIREIEKASNEASVPIVALTANTQDAQLRHCLEAGMNSVLIKPVKLEELRKHLAAYLEVTN